MTATQKSLLGNGNRHEKCLLGNDDSHTKSTLSNDDSHTKKLTCQMAMMIVTYSYTSLLGNDDRHKKAYLAMMKGTKNPTC